MAILYSYPCTNLNGSNEKITISTWPVVMNQAGTKVLLHIGTSTGKYQFIGWRLDDSLSPRENALMRAREVLWDRDISLIERDPLVINGMIERDGNEENLILIHYLASITDEANIGDAEWSSLEEVILLDAENRTSSENVRIASIYFLTK
jgi:hypothetical protein